jgi:hypothetical protein
LTEKLHTAGVRYDTLIIPYAQHGFDFVFGGLSEQIVESVVLRFLAAAPTPSPETPAVPDAGTGTESDGMNMASGVAVEGSTDAGVHENAK